MKYTYLPTSASGYCDIRFMRYIAGTADTKIMPMPPADVAAVWTVQFSLGPKGPPHTQPGRKSMVKALDSGFRMAKPKMAPKS